MGKVVGIDAGGLRSASQFIPPMVLGLNYPEKTSKLF